MAVSEDNARNLLHLPNELLGGISQQSDWRDILLLTESSTEAHRVFSNNEVWRPLCKKYFPQTTDNDTSVTSYKAEFKRLYQQTLSDVSARQTLLKLQSPALQADRGFIRELLKRNGGAIVSVADKFKNDIEMANAAIDLDESNYRSTYPRAILHCGNDVLSDKDTVLKVQSCLNDWNGQRQLHNVLPKELQQDKDIVLNYLRFNPSDIKKFNVCNDVEFIISLMHQVHTCYKFLPLEMKSNLAVVSAAVSAKGMILKEVPRDVKQNREIVKLALAQNGLAIHFTDFTDDEEMVNIAVGNNPAALYNVDDRFKNDYTRVLDAISREPELIKLLEIQQFSEDQQLHIVKAALENRGHYLEHLSAEHKKNYALVYTAVSNHGTALRHAAPTLQNDQSIVEQALRNTNKPHKVLSYTSEQCKLITVINLLQNEPTVIKRYVNNLCLTNAADAKFAHQLLCHDGLFLVHLNHDFRNDKLFVGTAITQNPEACKHAMGDILADPDVQTLYRRVMVNNVSFRQVDNSPAMFTPSTKVETFEQEKVPDTTPTGTSHQ